MQGWVEKHGHASRGFEYLRKYHVLLWRVFPKSLCTPTLGECHCLEIAPLWLSLLKMSITKSNNHNRFTIFIRKENTSKDVGKQICELELCDHKPQNPTVPKTAEARKRRGSVFLQSFQKECLHGLSDVFCLESQLLECGSMKHSCLIFWKCVW